MPCIVHGADCNCNPGELLRPKRETFYQHDSLTNQDLRIVKHITPTQINFYTFDLAQNSNKHDHNYIDLKNGYAGYEHRGQQR
jgi:hypothetical protein